MDDQTSVPGGLARQAPLRRLRVERTALVFALVVLALMVPVAAVAGSVLHAGQVAESAEQQRTRRQAEATLLADAPAAPDGSGHGSAGGTVDVRAEWRTPNGARRVGTVPAPRGRPAGGTVAVWLDPSGAVVPAPLTAAGAAVVAALYAAALWLTAALLVAGLYGLVRLNLARRRDLDWAAAWAAAEPRWSGRVD